MSVKDTEDAFKLLWDGHMTFGLAAISWQTVKSSNFHILPKYCVCVWGGVILPILINFHIYPTRLSLQPRLKFR